MPRRTTRSLAMRAIAPALHRPTAPSAAIVATTPPGKLARCLRRFYCDREVLRVEHTKYEPFRATTAANMWADSRGRRLAYRSIGAGKAIVLCSRFRGNMDLWDPLFLDTLAVLGFRVITFDY